MRDRRQIRRFIVDCHNGQKYWHNEFDFYCKEGFEESDENILTHIREEILKDDNSKIYFLIEVVGEFTLADLELMNTKEFKRHTRIIFYNPFWEPLSMYFDML